MVVSVILQMAMLIGIMHSIGKDLMRGRRRRDESVSIYEIRW